MLALVYPDFVDGHDVRMLQARRCGGFGAEPLHKLRPGERPNQQHLQGDDAVQADLAGLIDNAHPAPTNLLQQCVIAKVLWR